MKYATKDNMRKDKGYKDNSYVPEMLTGGILTGLVAAGLISGHPGKTFGALASGGLEGGRKGLENALKRSKMGKTTKQLSAIGKAIKKATKPNYDAFVDFTRHQSLQEGLGRGHKFDKARTNELYKDFRRQDSILSDFAEGVESKWRLEQEFGAKDKLSKVDFEELQNVVNKQWNADVLDEATDTAALWRKPGDTLKNVTPKKEKTKEFGANIGAGLTMGAGSLAVHAVGEKYFDKQDDDKVRAIIQNSFRNKPTEKSPHERAEDHMMQLGKFAAYTPSDIVDAAKRINKKEILRNIGEVSAAGAIDATVIAGIPLAIRNGLGIDIKSGFKKVDKDDNSGNIVIDVPLEALTKKASVGETSNELVEELAKNPALKKFLEKRRDTAIRVLPWSAAYGAVSMAGRDENSLAPLAEGNARITIQTKAKNQNSNDILMRRASEESQRDHDLSDDSTTLLEEIKKSMAAVIEGSTEKGINKAKDYNPKDGLTGKNYQFRKKS